MKTRILIITFVLATSMGSLASLISTSNASQSIAHTASSSQSSVPLPEFGGLYTNRRTDGVLNAFNQAVFGPKSCTAYGDPYSPLNSIWAPGYYTYKYRILIPPDYPSDVVRVELFDPDSINNTTITTTLSHTQVAIEKGHSPTETIVCDENQVNPCVIDTGEKDLLSSHPELSYDQVNPFWMVRIDENRGNGGADGDGSCNTPSTYTARYNTQTVFELSYLSQNVDGSADSISLARYTGQVGDGIRDNGGHLTDMHWVSPGAAKSFDQPAFVPVDSGSPGSFEVDLTQDVPGIITNPLTGYRELYLDVTAVSGASENGFEIWAGPPNYINSVPSEANARNLYIIDHPQTHSSAGITTFALDVLPQNANIDVRIELPLLYLSPNYAGQTITITAFDIENFFPSPVTFYMDSISQADWSMTFGQNGIDDPDGVVPAGVRCLPGSCSNEWIEPAYQIQLPDFTPDCDPGHLDPQICTPFYGGRLMVSFLSRPHETYAWTATVPEEPVPDSTVSCSTFPIALSQGSVSVSPPGSPTNAYPAAGDFDYPATPPSYSSFVSHVPGVLLSKAQEGYVYRLYDGFDSGDFGWLRWNDGRPDDDVRLAASLLWPGNSKDYQDHSYTEDSPASPLFSWIVDGYVNPDNNLDIKLNITDPILAKMNVISPTVVQPIINTHIDNQRKLQLVVWDESNAISGTYKTARLGVFRIVGYHIEETVGDSWLALEFSHWNTACGQSGVKLEDVSLVGSTNGFVKVPYTFLANAQPVTATLPVTYTWQATGQTMTSHTNNFRDEATFTWSQPGTKTITVTAQNKEGVFVQDVHSIFIDLRHVYLPVIVSQN